MPIRTFSRPSTAGHFPPNEKDCLPPSLAKRRMYSDTFQSHHPLPSAYFVPQDDQGQVSVERMLYEQYSWLLPRLTDADFFRRVERKRNEGPKMSVAGMHSLIKQFYPPLDIRSIVFASQCAERIWPMRPLSAASAFSQENTLQMGNTAREDATDNSSHTSVISEVVKDMSFETDIIQGPQDMESFDSEKCTPLTLSQFIEVMTRFLDHRRHSLAGHSTPVTARPHPRPGDGYSKGLDKNLNNQDAGSSMPVRPGSAYEKEGRTASPSLSVSMAAADTWNEPSMEAYTTVGRPGTTVTGPKGRGQPVPDAGAVELMRAGQQFERPGTAFSATHSGQSASRPVSALSQNSSHSFHQNTDENMQCTSTPFANSEWGGSHKILSPKSSRMPTSSLRVFDNRSRDIIGWSTEPQDWEGPEVTWKDRY